MIKGYKFFKEGFKSNYGEMQYKVGETYIYNGEIELCKSGFHFSRELKDAFLYYYEDAKHCCKVEGSGEIIEGKDKVVCSEIHIKEELDFNNVLKKLSDDEDWFVRRYVVLNENCPVDVLEKLSEDNDYYVRQAVAENENCPVFILGKLSNDEDCGVRENVAENENCPEDILRKLSEDEDCNVRYCVAENKNCPGDILGELFEDKDWRVRKNVALNKNCPTDILKKLSEDEKSYVKDAAIECLKRLK